MGSHKGILFFAALAGAAIAGWGLARMTAEGRTLEAAAELTTEPATAPVARVPQVPELSAPERVPRQERPSAPERIAPTEEGALFHGGLQEYGREGIRRGWDAVRGQPIPAEILGEGLSDYEHIVLESPEGIGRRLGAREDERDAAREDAATGGVFALLEALDQGQAGPLTEFTTSPDAFERFFARASQETSLNGIEHLERLGQALEDGVTVDFPAGIFKVLRPLPRGDVIPRDVTLAGAGMDATLLLIDEFQASERLRNLTLRDCTIRTKNYLFDIRSALSSIQLERVRIIGFDIGAGSSCIFGTDGTAIYARDSRFEGGYGRSPRNGQLFDERSDALLARFEGCTFELLNLATGRIRPGASVVFANCRMVDILDRRPPETTEHRGILFPGTVVDLYDWSGGNPATKNLNQLFPDWEARVGQ